MQHVSSAVAVTKGKERTTFIIAIDTSGMRGTCALRMHGRQCGYASVLAFTDERQHTHASNENVHPCSYIASTTYHHAIGQLLPCLHGKRCVWHPR